MYKVRYNVHSTYKRCRPKMPTQSSNSSNLRDKYRCSTLDIENLFHFLLGYTGFSICSLCCKIIATYVV